MSAEDREEELAFTVATVWREERVSCPHPDVLRAHLAGSLQADAAAFVAFHLDESQCPYCNAVVEDLDSERAPEPSRPRDDDLEASRTRVLRSTVSALRRAASDRE